MVFPLSFNSFGDIITAANLAVRIAQALSSSRGSSFEYQYLIQELDSLAYALELANVATRTRMLRTDIVNGILGEIARCREVMDALWKRVQGYQAALGGSPHKSGGVGTSWRKIGWALFKSEDVRETRVKLATHRANLITLMTACSMSNLDELKSQSARFEAAVRERLDEICRAVRQLPATLGYSASNAVILLDWCGGETVLPMDLCRTRTQFLATLNAVAFNWPAFARQYAANPCVFCEETDQYLVDPRTVDIDGASTIDLVPGNTLRVTASICISYAEYPEEWRVENHTAEMTFGLDCAYCDECRRGGRSSLFSLFSATHQSALETGFVFIDLGCSPTRNSWRVTANEQINCHGASDGYVLTFHDPKYAGCPMSDVGIAADLYSWEDAQIEDTVCTCYMT